MSEQTLHRISTVAGNLDAVIYDSWCHIFSWLTPPLIGALMSYLMIPLWKWFRVFPASKDMELYVLGNSYCWSVFYNELR